MTELTELQEALQRVKARISTPQKWVKGRFTRKRKCCLVGAIWKEAPDHDYLIEPLIQRIRKVLVMGGKVGRHESNLGWYDLSHWNDLPTTKHEEVIRVIDAALEE